MFKLIKSEPIEKPDRFDWYTRMQNIIAEDEAKKMSILIKEYDRIKQIKNKDSETMEIEKYYGMIFEDPELIDFDIAETFMDYYFKEINKIRFYSKDKYDIDLEEFIKFVIFLQEGRCTISVRKILFNIFKEV